MREISIYLGSNDVFIGRRRCKTNTRWKKEYLILLFLTLFYFHSHILNQKQMACYTNMFTSYEEPNTFFFATVSCPFSLELLFQWHGSMGYEVACKLQSSIVMENNNWCKHDNIQLVQFTNVFISTL